MGALKRIPLEFIQKFGPRNLLQQGAQDGNSIIWSNTLGEYTPGNPVALFANNTFQGRVAEINIQGNATTSVIGNRATISVNAGAIAVNGQSASQINTGANITATVSNGVATLNVNAPSGGTSITLNNANVGHGLVQSPGTSSSFTMRDLVGIQGVNITNMGTYLAISGGMTIHNSSSFVASGITTLDFYGASSVLNMGGGTVRVTVSGGGGSSGITLQNNSTFIANGITTLDFQGSATVQNMGAGLARIIITNASGGGLIGTNGNGLSVSANTVSLALANAFSPGAMPALSNNPATFMRGDGFWGLMSAAAVTSVNGSIGAINLISGSNFNIVNLGGGNFRFDATGGGGTSGVTLSNGVLGAGLVSTPGFNTTHTLKGLVGTGGTTVTDMGSHLVINSTATGSSANTVEVRWNNVTVNPAAFIFNFKGAGIANVSNGVGVEIDIPGAVGSIAGVSSFNGATGAIQLQAGSNNTITPLGGGIFRLDTFSSNGGTPTTLLSVGTGVPSFFGAAPTYNMKSFRSLTPATLTITDNGSTIDLSVTVPSGGPSGVTSVISGNSTVLQVSPTSGNVVVTPLGFSGVFTPTWNATTQTLAVPNLFVSSGIVSNIGTTFLTISAGASLPSGTQTQTLAHNGVTWIANSQIYNNTSIPAAGIRLQGNTSQNEIRLEVTDPSSFTSSGMTVLSDGVNLFAQNGLNVNAHQVNINNVREIGYVKIGRIGPLPSQGIISMENSIFNSNARLGFFGVVAVPRPQVQNGNTAQLFTALNSLGLIQLI